MDDATVAIEMVLNPRYLHDLERVDGVVPVENDQLQSGPE